MATAGQITALESGLTLLQADATLSTYVDDFSIASRYRPATIPGMTRHAIQLIPGATEARPGTVKRNLEQFTIRVRLVIKVWDPTDEDAILLARTVVGIGTSQVGFLQFAEDVKNAVRKQELTGLAEETAIEADAIPDISQVPNEAHDEIFYESSLNWNLLRVAYHEAALR